MSDITSKVTLTPLVVLSVMNYHLRRNAENTAAIGGLFGIFSRVTYDLLCYDKD